MNSVDCIAHWPSTLYTHVAVRLWRDILTQASGFFSRLASTALVTMEIDKPQLDNSHIINRDPAPCRDNVILVSTLISLQRSRIYDLRLGQINQAHVIIIPCMTPVRISVWIAPTITVFSLFDTFFSPFCQPHEPKQLFRVFFCMRQIWKWKYQ